MARAGKGDVTSVSLLERVRDPADEDSWAVFVGLYASLIEKWLRQKGLTAEDATDVQQDVMTVVVREMPRFEHSGRTGAFRNWLRTVTSNRLHEFWRSRKRISRRGHISDLADALGDATSELSRQFELEHDRYMLEQLLEMVRPNFQPASLTAFRRVVLEGRDARATAEELDMTVNAVRIAQSRVLRQLRELGSGLIG